ncbi:MAG: hypothetical protein K0R65_620 [Crocinitomicaceae bacterium]|jgi:hypothetical protein|nr:hypothetical protein [Crocinitomicaceae bacterium]
MSAENTNIPEKGEKDKASHALEKEARMTDSPHVGAKSAMEDTQEREISSSGGKDTAREISPEEKKLRRTEPDEIPPGDAPGTDKADPTDTSGAINNELNKGG